MGVRARMILLATVVLGVVPVALPTRPAVAATASVVVRNFAFASTSNCNGIGGSASTIQAGDTVVWRVCEGGHTVTADDGRFDSGNNALTPGQTFSFTFPSAGTFDYHCRIHSNMTGSVIVIGAPSLTTGPPATTTTRPATTTTTAAVTTTTTSRPTTTVPATTTTTAPVTTTTEEGEEDEEAGGLGAERTTTTDRTERLEGAGADEPSDDDGGNAGAVAALLAAISVVGGIAFWLWRRISSSS